MDCAASIQPGSTLASAESTWREKNGTEPNTSGTITPRTPMRVPMMSLVRFISTAMRMTNGMERNRLMTLSST